MDSGQGKADADPIKRYLVPESLSAANRSIQSFRPAIWMKHQFLQFEDGLNSLLGGRGAPEFAVEGANVLTDVTLSPIICPDRISQLFGKSSGSCIGGPDACLQSEVSRTVYRQADFGG